MVGAWVVDPCRGRLPFGHSAAGFGNIRPSAADLAALGPRLHPRGGRYPSRWIWNTGSASGVVRLCKAVASARIGATRVGRLRAQPRRTTPALPQDANRKTLKRS
jgi:hypothetical protein